jgi:DNA-binding MarR family transcriptional regulator
MSHPDLTVTQIAELLPEVMRRLAGGRSVPTGMREVTIPQARALRAVASSEACTMGELAGSLHVTMGAATGLVDRLVQQGLVQREPDANDRRIVRVRLTAAGRRAHAAVVRGARRRLSAALEKLSPEQRGQIAAALVVLRDALGEGEEAG